MAEYNRKDRLYQAAKDAGYRSRAAYKLLELNDKLRLLKSGMRVLDLGAFAGGWLQVAAEKVGPKGRVVGVDLRAVAPFTPKEPGGKEQNTTVFLGDVSNPEIQDQLAAKGPYDLVLCDMSPHLTGITPRDNALTAELLELAFSLNSKFLKIGGSFVAKSFPCEDVEVIHRRYRSHFEKLTRTVLQSSRNTSNEFYFVGHRRKEGA